MEIEIQLKREHWIKFNKFVQKHRRKELNGIKSDFFKNLVLYLILTLIFIVFFPTVHGWQWPTAIFVMSLFITIISLFLWDMYRLQSSLAPSELGTFIGNHRFVFKEDGIHSEGKGYKAYHDWNVIKSVERNDGIIILFLDTAFGFLFPENQLENPTDFIKMVNHRSAFPC